MYEYQNKELKDINLNQFYQDCYIQITSGFGIDLEYLDIIKKLIIEFNIFQAYKQQTHPLSHEVIENMKLLLRTDGINSKKEVLGILETYQK